MQSWEMQWEGGLLGVPEKVSFSALKQEVQNKQLPLLLSCLLAKMHSNQPAKCDKCENGKQIDVSVELTLDMPCLWMTPYMRQ